MWVRKSWCKTLSKPQLILLLAATVGFVLILFSRRASKRRASLVAKAQAWPAFVDSVASSLLAGLTIHESLIGSLPNAPKPLSAEFELFARDLEVRSVNDALSNLARRLELAACDEFALLLQVNARLGGAGLVSLVQDHSKRVRKQNAIETELRTKVAATLAMAKLAVIAPWVLLVLLMARPETAHSFDNTAGVMILLFGLAVCVLAYQLVGALGTSKQPRRIYAPR
jgi:tight adherence protein B